MHEKSRFDRDRDDRFDRDREDRFDRDREDRFDRDREDRFDRDREDRFDRDREDRFEHGRRRRLDDVRPRLNIVVRPSDTLFFLAGIFRVSIDEILAVNPEIADPDVIFPGQIVTIPSAAPVPPNPGFARAQYLVRSGDTLFFIAQDFGISLNDLIAANPQITNPNQISVTQVINLPITPPLPPPVRGAIQIYVSAGETLTSIARRTGTDLEDIIDANPQIEDPDIIFAGQIINVPLHSMEPYRGLNIVIIEGDTLFELAEIFGITVADILAVNPGIIDAGQIFPGQIIAIPAAAPTPPDPGFARAQYLVRPGDTLFSIAQRFGLTVSLLLEENPQITDPDRLFVNQVINLPVTPPLPPPPRRGTIQIYVSVGETLLSIAGRTGTDLEDIIDANPQIEDPDIIFVGQIINVPL